MSNILKFFGALLIVSCLFVGGSIIQQIDWDSYEIAKKVYAEFSTNPYAEQKYVMERTMVNGQLGTGIAVILSGIISGLLLFSVAQIIDYLKDISNNLSKAFKQSTEG